jgi:hypothetical protein
MEQSQDLQHGVSTGMVPPLIFGCHASESNSLGGPPLRRAGASSLDEIPTGAGNGQVDHKWKKLDSTVAGGVVAGSLSQT